MKSPEVGARDQRVSCHVGDVRPEAVWVSQVGGHSRRDSLITAGGLVARKGDVRESGRDATGGFLTGG